MSQENKLYMSPIVECRHAHIKNADTAFSKTGIYQIDLILERNNPEHRKFVQELSALRPEGAKNPVCKVEDKDSPFGIVKCKQNAVVQGANGKTYEGFQPVVFDSQGNKLKTIPLIGNGSKIRVQVEPRPYTPNLQGGGVRLRPVAIQIVELVEYVPEEEGGEPTPAGVGGFGAVQGGYVAGPEPKQPEQPGFDSVQDQQAPPVEAYDDVPDFGETTAPFDTQGVPAYEDF